MFKINYTWKNIITVFTGVLVLSACSRKLDKFPETAVTDASFWKTPNDLISAANALYLSLPVIANSYQDNYSDIAYATGPNNISDGSRLAPATSADWNDNYTLIRRSNTILEKSGSITGDQKIINQARGEASFFRAWAYFELLKRFGDVPLILRTFVLGDSLTQAFRTPRAQVITQIYADLDYAASVVPEIDVQANADYGRITKGAALSFKSRVALFEGTREKFFGYGNSKADLTIAVNAAGAVVNSGKYDIWQYAPKPDSSYFYLFQFVGEGKANKENVLVRLYGKDIANKISTHNVSGNIEQAYITPTKALLDLYLYKDGLPIAKSAFAKEQTTTLSQFENRDPRAGMTVFNKKLWYATSFYVPSFQFTVTGYKVAKWFNKTDWDNGSFTDFAIIRYAEVLLNYAEALYELNGSITDDQLNTTINKIRNRNGAGGVTPLTNGFVTANGLDMREEIRRERTVELAMEGYRYWDLLRWKTAEVELPKAILGSKYIKAEQGDLTNPKLTADGFIIAQPADKRSFRPNRDYLWPIPTTEFAYDPNLIPNPNW
ncbi:RagB/SusD family nutrient uptake outer membrane protein [Chitinophaga arvensicola]|uniref:Starch-binding associating with outer membrane n=1 Tax=Chitinophaga arvensicola TaxID=29529 RepID=A0A1I0RTS7_9BACT|nr:RagB/SusD family nutrient uptake outer membrane protein [Chitinophaga arvensicola]SEW44721.1 Starch-binding associating with outer membrane [Chitinophaga arvensicola]